MAPTPSRLSRLLRPRSIAVFGGLPAERVIEQCHRFGYSGAIWSLHPRRAVLHGYRCYREVADLPNAPDAAFVAVNRYASIAVVRELAAHGAGGAVCYASGFQEAEGEVGDGAALSEALLAAAGEMPLIGPNCYGFINCLDAAPLWPDLHGAALNSDTGVALITQSSNVAINLSMQQRGLPLAYLFTVGNQLQLGMSEIGAGLLDDDRVTALGFYIEGLDDANGFARMADKARRLGKAVVVVKAGRSTQARRALQTHTASLAGNDAASDAFFAACGVARVASLEVLLETLALLHLQGPLHGATLCSMSCSGGEAALIADAAVGRKVYFRALSDTEKMRVKATLSDIVTVANPLDYHTFIWGDSERLYRCFAAMVGNGFDLSLLVLDFPRIDRCDDAEWEATVAALLRLACETRARLAVVSTLAENMPEQRAEVLHQQRIATLCGLDSAIAAIDAAFCIGAAWDALAAAGAVPCVSLLPATPDVNANAQTIDEPSAKALLREAGVAIPCGQLICQPAALETLHMPYPLVAKIVGSAHKSDSHGVRLNLRTARQLRGAVDALLALSPQVLVEKMVEDALVELVVGIQADPVYGLVMTLGSGGIFVEWLNDSATVLLPASPEAISRALKQLKLYPRLVGGRATAAADLRAAIAAIGRISEFAIAHAAQLIELEVNPLLVKREGHGAYAVDVLLRLKENPALG